MKILAINILGFIAAGVMSIAIYDAILLNEIMHLISLSMGATCYWASAKYIWKKDV